MTSCNLKENGTTPFLFFFSLFTRSKGRSYCVVLVYRWWMIGMLVDGGGEYITQLVNAWENHRLLIFLWIGERICVDFLKLVNTLDFSDGVTTRLRSPWSEFLSFLSSNKTVFFFCFFEVFGEIWTQQQNKTAPRNNSQVDSPVDVTVLLYFFLFCFVLPSQHKHGGHAPVSTKMVVSNVLFLSSK